MTVPAPVMPAAPMRPIPPDVTLRAEREGDDAPIEALYAAVFGPGRHTRAVARLRDDLTRDLRVGMVAERRRSVIGAIRQVRVAVGGRPAYLLGPLAVAETAAKQGIGRALMLHTIAAARETAADGILLVGDPPFYAPFGFVPAAHAITIPGPVELHRVQQLPLRAALSGRLEPTPWDD